ncbi:MAG: hypothetical protein NTU61_02550 [Candidatus Altiarchaeota archaeon]|nr:hypothetical protein [Candidatus Altiarchaeota archaeon]
MAPPEAPVESNKSKDAETLKAVLTFIKNKGSPTEKDISNSLKIHPDLTKKYVSYLAKGGWVTVKSGLFGPAKVMLKNKKMVEKGEKIIPEDEESFYEVCSNLMTDFIGVMKLWSETEDGIYTVGLMVKRGDIIAVVFEHMDTVSLAYGDDAMNLVNEKFSGTKGNLEIYELSEEDFNKAIDENKDASLASPLRLSSLNIKIRKKFPKTLKKEQKPAPKGLFGFGGGDKLRKKERMDELKGKRDIEKLGLTEGFSLIGFARNLPSLDPLKSKRFEELRKTIVPQRAVTAADLRAEKLKQERLQQIKDQQDKPETKLQDVFGIIPKKQLDMKDIRRDEIKKAINEATGKITIAMPTEEEIKKTVSEGIKIETNIDKLYQIVEKYGHVKINDALVNALKVSKIQIEEWAMILEEHGLLELKYPTIGEPEIISKKSNKK